jgi:hypothetical protein
MSGQVSGMAQRKKKKETKTVMLRQCKKIVKVCSLRFSGTFHGANLIPARNT